MMNKFLPRKYIDKNNSGISLYSLFWLIIKREVYLNEKKKKKKAFSTTKVLLIYKNVRKFCKITLKCFCFSYLIAWLLMMDTGISPASSMHQPDTAAQDSCVCWASNEAVNHVRVELPTEVGAVKRFVTVLVRGMARNGPCFSLAGEEGRLSLYQ